MLAFFYQSVTSSEYVCLLIEFNTYTMNRMKKIVGVAFFVLVTVAVSAQTRINASDIMDDIKKGKKISYTDATIVGVLDLTFMEEQSENLPKNKIRRWWKQSTSNNVVAKNISSKISFVNCTFEDHVFAYIHDEDTKYTFVANFENNVVFENCTFKEMALFKYSKFEGEADFSDSRFEGASSFKYAKFRDNTNFENTVYVGDSTFKYTKFDTYISFANSTFEESATFKYAAFRKGVSFNKTRFEEDLNIKYTKVTGDFDITGMHVEYGIDSKYTSINGKKFKYNNQF